MDTDFLSHILKGEYDQGIEAESVCALFSQEVQGTTLIEAYSCNVWVTETLDRTEDPKAMSEKDWIIAQNRDPVIREITLWIKKNSQGGKYTCVLHWV